MDFHNSSISFHVCCPVINRAQIFHISAQFSRTTALTARLHQDNTQPTSQLGQKSSIIFLSLIWGNFPIISSHFPCMSGVIFFIFSHFSWFSLHYLGYFFIFSHFALYSFNIWDYFLYFSHFSWFFVNIWVSLNFFPIFPYFPSTSGVTLFFSIFSSFWSLLLSWFSLGY